jgi:hypothetical protein
MVKASMLVALVFCAGCSLFSGFGPFCPSKAIGLTVDYLGESKNSEELELQISIDTRMPFRTPKYTHSLGGTKETLEIDLSDYEHDRFKMMTVIAVVRRGGMRVGAGRQTREIENDCTSIDLLLDDTSYKSDCLYDSDCSTGVVCSNNCCGNNYCL